MKVLARKALLAVVVGVLAAVSGAAVALAAEPGAASEGPVMAGKNPKVKPSTIQYTGDGSGFLAGSHKQGRSFGSLHWSTWNEGEALGSGADWINNCTPDCAGGHFNDYAVKLKLYAAKTVGGHDVFTRMDVTYTGIRPRGINARTQTWKLRHSDGTYLWLLPEFPS